MLKNLASTAAIVLLVLVVAAAAGLTAEWYLRGEALTDAFARLRLFHELRRTALQDYLTSMASDVRAASENARMVDAVEKLTFAWSTFDTEARRTLRGLYVEGNRFPAKDRDKLDDAGDGSYYSLYHRDFHGWAKRFRKHFGYYDVFLIGARGDILYSVAKESDFATNLKTGPYRTSPLAEVFRRAVSEPGEVVAFSDFAAYQPSGGDPAAFAGHAIKKGDEVVGVFAVQIPAEPLNAMMHFTAGMGQTGETYLVGPDRLMRSQSRFSAESTLLKTKVESESVRESLGGKSGAHIVADYRGVPVLSVYAPVDFGGQNWALLAEIDEAEILGKRRPWLVGVVAVIAGLITAALALLAKGLSAVRPKSGVGAASSV